MFLFGRKYSYVWLFALHSGYGIAAKALTAIMRAHDGRGPPTFLTYGILSMLGLSSPDELIGYFYALAVLLGLLLPKDLTKNMLEFRRI